MGISGGGQLLFLKPNPSPSYYIFDADPPSDVVSLTMGPVKEHGSTSPSRPN